MHRTAPARRRAARRHRPLHDHAHEAHSSIEGLFEENAKARLSLSKEGGGQASITSSPVGIYCLNSCGSASVDLYSEPTPEEVTLSWTLNAGTSSIEWTTGAGTCTGVNSSNGNCKVTMSEAATTWSPRSNRGDLSS